MCRREKTNAVRVTRRLAGLAMMGATVGAIAMGCSGKKAPISETTDKAPAVAPPSPPAAPARVSMPAGWRNFHLGMSEAAAKKVADEYRKDTATKWSLSPATNLMTVRFDLRNIDKIAVDRKRFHEWSIEGLDEGARLVRAWFDDGKLVIILVEGTATPDSYLRKAADAYGAAPQNATFGFFDERTMMRESRSVASWRGDEVTAVVWISDYKPNLLLWSNAAMEGYAIQYQNALDAPTAARLKANEAKENQTKF